MDNLSGLTIGNTTFPVLANGGGGGGDMPIHVNLPKSASDSTPSGVSLPAWPNGMRYVYCSSTPPNDDVSAFIPPEYMGNGSVHINDKQQIISGVLANASSPYYLRSMNVEPNGNTVIGDSISGAVVKFEAGVSRSSSSANSTKLQPMRTGILFFVNTN